MTQLHEMSIGELMQATSNFIHSQPVRDRDWMWRTFIITLYQRMSEDKVRIPATTHIASAMEAIGISLTDFLEPARMA